MTNKTIELMKRFNTNDLGKSERAIISNLEDIMCTAERAIKDMKEDGRVDFHLAQNLVNQLSINVRMHEKHKAVSETLSAVEQSL